MALKFLPIIRSSGMLQQLLRPSQLSHRISGTASFHSTHFRLNEHIINIQDEDDFKDRVIGNATPVIVDFHASWCGPCKLLGPRLEALVGAQNGDVILAKVDIDEMPDLAMDHGVEAVPTVLGMKNGKIEDKFVGLKEDDQLTSFIRKLTGK